MRFLCAVIGAGSALLVCSAYPRAAALQAPPVVSVWDGVYTDAQAARGEALSVQYCRSCHGLDMNSGEPGPWLYGQDFATRYDSKTVADLLRRLLTMPPDRPGSLDPAAMADLAAWVLAQNEFPPGSRELSSDITDLQRIRIAVKKP